VVPVLVSDERSEEPDRELSLLVLPVFVFSRVPELEVPLEERVFEAGRSLVDEGGVLFEAGRSLAGGRVVEEGRSLAGGRVVEEGRSSAGGRVVEGGRS
jgi:hypothetical protein